MKPHSTKGAPRFQLIEPLEARIAPATIRIGAVGVNENVTDTEYHEMVDPTDPAKGPRPDPFNSLSFVDSSVATDQISLAVDPERTANGSNTYFLKLNAGDQVDHFTDANNYRPLIIVRKGRLHGLPDAADPGDQSRVIAFFTDLNNNNEYDDGELTGLSLGRDATVEIAGSVNGDIVTNLNQKGTRQTGDDTVDVSSLVSFKQGIRNLEVLGGSVAGNVLSGGDIQSMAIAGNVNSILVGSAAAGVKYDLFKFENPNNPAEFLPPRFTTGLSVPAGKTGATISNLLVKSVTDRIEAGRGGAGGIGGALKNIEITADTDGVQILAGAGGLGDAIVKQPNGGAGGSVKNVFITGIEDLSPNSPLGVVIKAGAGGDAVSNKHGGAGGKLSNVFVGFELVGGQAKKSGELGADSVVISSGAGGAGKFGGKAGSLSAVQVRVRTPDASGEEVVITGGLGGSSLSPGGSAGKGGSIADVEIRNQIISPDSDILVLAGSGGTTVGNSTGADGGSIARLSMLGYDVQVIAGDGSDGKTGGLGGSVKSVTLIADEFILTRNVIINAGLGGNASAGNAGDGGFIDGLVGAQVDLEAFLINSGIAANGGTSLDGKGGRGGVVSNIQITDIDRDAAVIEGLADIRAGRGGDGTKGGKAGGSFNSVAISAQGMNLIASAGRGGDSLRNGNGGAGGGFQTFTFASESLISGFDVTGTVHAGAGGNGVGSSKVGGLGGGAQKVNLNFSGDVSLIAGAGGDGQVSTGTLHSGAAGSGGSIASSGIFAGPSVDIDPLTGLPDITTQSSAEIRAGNAGVGGGQPGHGGNITGDPKLIIVDGVPVPNLLIGIRAEKNITVVAGNGTHGGNGGDIRNMTYGSIGEFLVPTPVGNILVQAGNGSGEGKFAGRGGLIDGINGAVGSVPNAGLAAGVIQTTKLLAGHGGGGADVTKSGKGGSVSNVSLSRGGGAGIVLTIQAGDAGDTPTAKTGANGGNVSTIGIGNIDDLTIVRSIGAGDGGDARKQGGAGGGIFDVKVQDHDIGVRTGEVYGYTHMGGLFAGIGGAAERKGKAGNVDQVSADAIASIVAGRGRVPEMANTVSNVYVSGTVDDLLLTRNLALVSNGAFRLQFEGAPTALLPAGATPTEVKNALNALPGIIAAGGVNVDVTLSGGYKVTFAQNGQRALITGVEQVPTDVSQTIQGSIGNTTAIETTPGIQILPVTEVRSGQDPLPVIQTVPGTTGATTSEITRADDVLLVNEVQQFDLRFLSVHPTGKFELAFGVDVTVPQLSANATAVEIAAALNLLPSIVAIGGVTVTESVDLPRVFNIALGTLVVTPDSFLDQPPIFVQFFVQEVQRLDLGTVSALPTSKFLLTYLGQTTPQLPVTANAANVATALNALTSIATAGGVTVASPIPGAFDITFNTIGDKADIDSEAFVQELQTLDVGAFTSVPAGEFRISFINDTTSPLPPNATKDQIQAALNLLPAVQAAGNVTVTPGLENTFSVLFGSVGEQVSLAATGVLPEVQSLDLSAVTTVDTGEFTLHIEHFANITETTKGTAVPVPTTTTQQGLIVDLTAITVADGTPNTNNPPAAPNGSAEEQFLDLFPLQSMAGPTGEFYLIFQGQRTIFLPALATAGQVDAALEALPAMIALATPPPALPLLGAVTVTADPNAPQAFSVLFNVNGNQQQITGVGGFREVQTLNTTQVAAIAGGEMFFTLGAESTVPLPSNATAPQIDAALDALPSLQALPPDIPGATVTQTSANRFNVQFGDFGDQPQLFGQGGGVANRETERLDLSQYAAGANTTFKLTFNGDTTVALPVAADANQIMTELNALPSVRAARTDNTGAVAVTTLSPNVFGITFNIFGDKPNIVGLLTRGTGTTVRLPFNASPADIEAALDPVSLADTIVSTDPVTGEFQVSYAEFGDQPVITTVDYIHEKQKIDVYQVGDFQLSFNNELTGVLPANATAMQVQDALNALTTVQGTGKLVTVKTNPDTSYSVVFGADDDQQPFSGVQFENIVVATSVDGGVSAREIQVLNAIKKGEYNTLFFTTSARLLGAVVDTNEIDSNVFKSFADINRNGVFDLGLDILHVGAFVLGDVPIDGLVMANVFDQVNSNVTPEAKLTAAGFFDHDNII